MDDWKLKVHTSVKLDKRDMFVSLYHAFIFLQLNCCKWMFFNAVEVMNFISVKLACLIFIL